MQSWEPANVNITIMVIVRWWSYCVISGCFLVGMLELWQAMKLICLIRGVVNYCLMVGFWLLCCLCSCVDVAVRHATRNA